MAYKVQLTYFRQTGKFLAVAETMITRQTLAEIWADINDMRRLGRLPSLRPGSGRDLFVVVDVPDHPQRVLHIVMPPCLGEDDVTPPWTLTKEPALLMRVPPRGIPQTTTTPRDVLKQPPNESVAVPDTLTPPGVPMDELLAGQGLSVRVCPHCGHPPENFIDEETIVE